MRITRPRATKLSQITIDADLAMGAHSITLGAGETVDEKDVSLLNPVGWVLLAEENDTNGGDVFTIDTGVMTPMDVYMIVLHIETTSNANYINLQINGLTGNSYSFVYVTGGGTLTWVDSQVAWQLFWNLDSPQQFTGIYYVQGKVAADKRAIFFGHGSAGITESVRVALRGNYISNLPTITRLKLVTIGNATGWVKIFGMNK